MGSQGQVLPLQNLSCSERAYRGHDISVKNIQRIMRDIKILYFRSQHRLCIALCVEALEQKNLSLTRLQVVYFNFFAALSYEISAQPIHKSSMKRSLVLQEAERYYVKACHELRLVAAPLPFKASQGSCRERSLGQDQRVLDNSSNRQCSLQLSAYPLPLTHPSPLSLPKGHDLVSDNLSRLHLRDLTPYEVDDMTNNSQISPKGLLPLRLPEKTKMTVKLHADKDENTEENEEAYVKLTEEQISPYKQNVMSLEYDVRKCINDVRAQQSQVVLRGASNGPMPIDKTLSPISSSSPLSTNPSNSSPMRGQSTEDRILKGRLREWKRDRFCSRKYEELCSEILKELEEKEKLFASIRDRHNNRLSLNKFSSRIVSSMSPIHE